MPRHFLPATLLVQSLGLLGLAWPAAAADAPPCPSSPGLTWFVSPRTPHARASMRVLVLSEQPRSGAVLSGEGPSGPHTLTVLARGGPPYFWLAEIQAPAAGRHRFTLTTSGGQVLTCRRVRVEPRPAPPSLGGQGIWPITASWTLHHEQLFAAFIEKLFDAGPGESPSWTPLHLVLRDPSRNLLYNHLSTDEDGPDAARAVVAKPDCADLPYFLRAYFAWKLGLPFGYRTCDRGTSRRAATCGELQTMQNAPIPRASGRPADRFSQYLRQQVSLVHSGSGRTGPADDETDLYPKALSRRSLRPGTVYVDPYGHLLVVARWIDQTKDSSGQVFAVDGHPDLSVGRKRFWRGAFLFSDNVQGAAGGFKAFRPLVQRGGTVVALTNEEIKKSKDYGDYSDEQYRHGIDGFYDRMDDLMNPSPLSPAGAHLERLKALYELVLERVGSVRAGEDYMRAASYRTMPMPSGPRIFETSGPWEDFSTPARDFRLLIAMDQVLGFPATVAARPGRFAMPEGKSMATVQSELQSQHLAFTREKRFEYDKSDGTRKVLTLAELLDRQTAMEVAYNPNDCVERRWGATSEDELASCKRRAPDEQRRRMETYRLWFRTRNRPPLR